LSVKNTIFKWIILCLGAVIALYTLVYSVREFTKVAAYQKSGTLTTDVTLNEDSLLVISILDTSEFVYPIYPSLGDIVVGVNDSSATLNRWNGNFFAPLEPGRVVPIEYIHNGEKFRTELRTHLPSTYYFLNILFLQVVRIFLTISFIVVGLWAFLKRPESGGVRALALFSFAMASFLIASVRVLSDRYAPFDIPLNTVFNFVFTYFVPFFGGFWLNLQLLFPRPKRFIRRYPNLAYAACYAPFIIILIDARTVGLFSQFLSFPAISLQIIAGFIILASSYTRARNSLEKRQLRLVLTGSGIGLFTLFLFLTVAIFFGEWLSAWRWNAFAVTLCFLALLLSPLSFGYAFQRYRLLEVEGKLRRGTRYFLVTAFLLGLFAVVVYLVGILLLRHLGITSQTPTFIIALGLALGFSPALRKVQGQVERRFYPERHNLREEIRDFLQKILAIPDRKTLWKQVEELLRDTIKVGAIYPVLKAQDSDNFYYDGVETEPTSFRINQGVAVRMEEDRRPIVVDEAIASARAGITIKEESWLKRKNVAMLLPMVVHLNLVGFLAIGFKSDGEDYSPEELDILNSLASQLALASENIRLLEDNIEKKRMEEELNMARVIQKGFLPETVPSTPGLKVAAGSRFCLEVAGDYYDVITLPDGETVLAVGDVSGKGAAAALLMANLQASLRTAIGVSGHLRDIVGRINDLIHSNTPPEQYITFFVGIFDPKAQTLTYVNAGHNQPMVIREDGRTILLDKGGLILGALPEVEYEQDTIQLQSGDLLLMYTDGVSEAMNAEEEEFGEGRILEYVRMNLNREPGEILAGLEKEVESFIGNSPLADDFTLIFGRVEGKPSCACSAQLRMKIKFLSCEDT